MNPDTLILVTLSSNHDVSFVQHKDTDFLDVKNTEFGAPIKHFARCANDNVIIQFCTTGN